MLISFEYDECLLFYDEHERHVNASLLWWI